MCGILVSITARSECRSSCRHEADLLSLLKHRGPHARGVTSLDLGWCSVHLGMARLKITDQADLAVPMAWGGVHAAYNGEIYNADQLRAELGGGFDTACDAEVLIKAWLAWGPDCLARLNGMFAFVLVDTRPGQNLVAAARDRAGEKPLYWRWRASHGCLSLASEAKALPGGLEECRCDDLDALECDCLEETPWAGVRRLTPGGLLLLWRRQDLAEPSVRRWWRLRVDPSGPCTPEAAAEELQPVLRDAIRIRARAEVPVACMLSGGLDSAIIQAVARAPLCYTVTFPEVDNMEPASEATAGAQLQPVTFGLEEAREVLPRVAYHLDTPAVWTAVCQWWMMRSMAQDGIRVCLSGEGADELFLGYSRYRALWWLQRARDDARLSLYGSTLDYLTGTRAALLARGLQRGFGLASAARTAEIVRRFDDDRLSLPRGAALIDFNVGMQVLLRMADRMAAAHSLENRSPFLDHRVIELAARLPDSALIDEERSKAVLLEVARRLGVSQTIILEKTKRGLFLPWNSWHAEARMGPRGAWDRRHFHRAMLTAWRSAFTHRAPRAREIGRPCTEWL